MAKNVEQAFPMQKPAGKTLLLVEGDESVAFFLRLIIQEAFDFDVLVVPDARQALELVRHLHVDLFILTDADGIELYDRLAEQRGVENVPAILLSTNVARWRNEIMKRHLLALSRPCKPTELLKAITFLLTLQHFKAGHAA